MSARKRGRGAGDAGGAVAWEPEAVPSSDEGAAFLGALFGGGASGLQALVRHAHHQRCRAPDALALTRR